MEGIDIHNSLHEKKTVIKFQELRIEGPLATSKHSPMCNANLDKYFKARHS